MKESFLFLSSRIFLKNFFLMVALVSLSIFLVFAWMKFYTRHGKSYEVDNYVGMNIQEAEKAASKHKFNLVVLDSTYIVGKGPGIILEQNPLPDAKVKARRSIYISITKAIPNDVALPDLVGNYDAINYTRKLQRVGLQSVIAKKQFDPNLAPNTILYVMYKGEKYTDDDISNGVKIPEGETIELVVSQRSSIMVDMPDLECLQYEEAKFLIQNYNLSLGSVIPDATVKDEAQAFVWKQQPPFGVGKMLKMGESMNIYLTQYKPDNCQ